MNTLNFLNFRKLITCETQLPENPKPQQRLLRPHLRIPLQPPSDLLTATCAQ